MLCFNSFTLFAQSRVGTFTNSYGWKLGDTSSEMVMHGVELTMEVKSSYSSGRLYYVVTFTNISDEDFSGGARISQNQPESTFFSVNLKPGESKQWGENFPPGLTTVYVLLRRDLD